MSKVASRRVISNRRRTVGLVHDERHAPALAGHAAQPVEQHRQAGRVDELHRAEVEHDRRLAAADRLLEQHAEARSRRDVDLAGDRDDVRALVEVLLGELELGLGERHGRLPTRPRGRMSNRNVCGAAAWQPLQRCAATAEPRCRARSGRSAERAVRAPRASAARPSAAARPRPAAGGDGASSWPGSRRSP